MPPSEQEKERLSAIIQELNDRFGAGLTEKHCRWSGGRPRLNEPWLCPGLSAVLAVMRELFEWDPEKAEQNRRKHGVSLPEGSTVFRDPLAITLEDIVHSETEQRYLLIGRSSSGRVLVVIHTERGRRIRLISARPATAQEKRVYEQGD